MKLCVLLENGTVGEFEDKSKEIKHLNEFIGLYVTVELNDENGNRIQMYGAIKEILEIY